MTYINKHERAFRHLANIKDDVEVKRSLGRIKNYDSTSDLRAWCDDIEQRRQHILELSKKPKVLTHGAVPLNDLIGLMGVMKSEKKGLKSLIKDEPLDEKKQEKLEDLSELYDEIVEEKKPGKKGCKGLNRIKGKRDRLLAEKRKLTEEGDNTSSGVTKDSTERSSEKETFSGKDKAKKKEKDDPFVVLRAEGPTKLNTSVKLNFNPSFSLDEPDPTTVIFRAQLPPKPSKSGPPERGDKRNREPDYETEAPKRKKTADEGAEESSSVPSKFKDDKSRHKRNKNRGSSSGRGSSDTDKERSEDDYKTGPKVKFKRKSLHSDDHPRYKKQEDSASTTTESFHKGPGKTVATGTPLISNLKKSREETSMIQPAKDKEKGNKDEESKCIHRRSSSEGKVGQKGKSKSPTKRTKSDERTGKQDADVKVKAKQAKDEKPGSPNMREKSKSPSKDKDADDKVNKDVLGEEKSVKGKEPPTIKEPEFEEETTEEAVIVKLGHHKDTSGAGDEAFKNKINSLTKQLEETNKTVETYRATCSNTCTKELEELETEIEDMKLGKIVPETIIRKHTALIKKCCNLIGELNIRNIPPTLLGKLNDMKNRTSNIDKLNTENDTLIEKVKNLKHELKQYKELPEKLKDYRENCNNLAKTREERDRLLEEVKRLKDALKETEKLKKDAQRVPDLQKELLEKEQTNKSSLVELTKANSQVVEMGDALAEAHREKDLLKNQLKALDLELSKMKDKAKENDILKVEKENLEAKLKDTKDAYSNFDDLIKKGKEYDNLKNERDLYKSKYEESVKLEGHCDMLRVEIDAAKVERDILVKKVSDMQACLCERERELMSAQAEIHLLKEVTKSEEGNLERDTSPQDASTAGESENSQILRMKVDTLEKELAQTNLMIAKKTSQIKHLQQNKGYKDVSHSDKDAVARKKKELETAKAKNKKLHMLAENMASQAGDEDFQQMLKESECAMKRIYKKLGIQDEHRGMPKVTNVEKRRLEGNSKSPDYERSFSQGPPVMGDCALLSRFKEHVDVLEAENAKLRANVDATICKNGQGGGYLKQQMAEVVVQKEKLEEQLRTEMSSLKKPRKPSNLPDCDC